MSVLDSARLLTEESNASLRPANEMDVEDDVEWVTDVYSQLNGTPMHNVTSRWQRLNKYRLFIGVFSLLLMGLGVALAVPRSSCVYSVLPSTGTDCHSVTAVSITVAVLLCLTGLLGCVASYRSARTSMSCCLAGLFFCYAVVCGSCLAYVVYSRVHQLENLGAAWRQLVSVGSPVVCDIEKTLQCSGFAEGQCCRSVPLEEEKEEDGGSGSLRNIFTSVNVAACFVRARNGTTYDMHTRNVVTWPHQLCLTSCAEWNEKTMRTCEAPLKAVVDDYFLHFVAILSLTTLLFLLVGSITVTGIFWKPRIDSRMEHRF